ncbi:MAG TPA: hypothetical protein H9795_05310 [Candidatus Fournierella merdigallinarum]|nr:hypothetical protein [Candidatus Fournierella merdigallinarum]
MAASKNDFDIAGYKGRWKVHHNMNRTKSKYDAYYMLKNPATKKVYTNAQMLADFMRRKDQYPGLALLLEPWIQELTARAQKNPDAEFSLHCSDATEERALARLKKMRWSELESLAQLLYRPLYERNLKYGDVNVRDFVMYQAKTLFPGDTPEMRTRLIGILENHILPEIGEVKLNALDAGCQKKALASISRKLSVGKTTRENIRRAYRGLILAIESSGWKGCFAGLHLIDILKSSSERNSDILNNSRVDHLDDTQRTALFQLLIDPGRLYDLFWVALLYCGMDPADIAGQTYGDIDELALQDGSCCYTILISRRVRKLHDRYSTLQATNENFPIYKFRRVVLTPWAGDILLRRLEQLRALGLSDDQIREMRLSSEKPGGAIVGPEELAKRLRPLLLAAGIPDATPTRTDNMGHAYRQKITEDVNLLLRDARYLAKRCGADDVMLHAMFGDAWTDTDEDAYLDLLGDRYAVARWQRLRRWSPLAPAPLPATGEGCLEGYTHAPARHILRAANPTDRSVTLTLSALYALRVYWAHNEKERSTS